MINWGIIGCGDVTEVKSGPAFSKVPDSRLVAVMRRDATKAADYAQRHNVPRWYADANELIHDPDVNAIYIATPPSLHEVYALAAIRAGKPVYVEKPMALNYAAAQNIVNAAAEANIKVTVAHYRRQWPLFLRLKELLQQKIIGDVRLVQLQFHKPAPTAADLADEKIAWRFDPAIAGGGLFHDLAPHQLDILYYLFGDVKTLQGIALNQGGYYAADDIVTGQLLFSNGILFSGSWCFTATEASDHCTIIGSEGSIHFSFFSGQYIIVQKGSQSTRFDFDPLPNVQQLMIAQTVQYFLGHGPNPCTAAEGAEIMRWIETLSKTDGLVY